MITKTKVIDKIEVLQDGTLQIREDTIIEEDGVVLASGNFHRRTISPDETPAPDEDARVVKVAKAMWTAKVKADYIAAKVQNSIE
jgi:hypothetical protein